MKVTKMKKIILLVITTILIMAGITSITTKANAASVFLGLERYRASGLSYMSLNGKVMWKISVYNGISGTVSNNKRAIYCIKGGPGFGSNEMGNTPTIQEYTVEWDLKNITELSEKYKNTIPTGQNYNSLIWVLEHCYVPAQNDNENADAQAFRSELLKAAGIPNSKISDDEIDIVQQLAVWYFTNTDEYQVKNGTFALSVKNRSDSEYLPIGDYFGDVGYDRLDDAQTLFAYFTENAKNAGAPTSSTNSVQVVQENATARLLGDNYIVGPYRINQTGTSTDYDLELSVVSANGSNIQYKLLNNNKVETSTNIKNLVGQDFYLSIPKTTNIQNAKIKVRTTAYQTSIKYRSTDAAGQYDQPVAEVIRNKQSTEMEININLSEFDLALRKFITQIDGRDVASRVPQVGAMTAQNGTTATKPHTKDPLTVRPGATVLYTIRIYNEGSLDGYAKQVTDYLPTGLELKSGSSINSSNGWSNPSGDKKTIVTTKLADKLINKVNGSNISYADLQIECVVTANYTTSNISLKNVAEITAHSDEQGNTNIVDRDSQPNNLTNDQKSNYNPGTSTQGWGYQDDDDYEELVLPAKQYDFALRKFITKINDKNVESRVPQVKAMTAQNGTTAIKEHRKDALAVEKGDKVLYTIRVYNEGELPGHVKEITDYLPEGLRLWTNSTINTENGWTTADGKTIKTTKLANTLLNEYNGTTLASADVQIECEVIEESTTVEKRLKNIAEITVHSDKDGNTNIKDRDSQPNNLTSEQKSNYNPGTSTQGYGYQDDDDYEELVLPAKQYDFALRKFITKVNNIDVETREPQVGAMTAQNGTTTVKPHRKDPVQVKSGDTVLYTIRVYNEGTLPGYVKEITDYLPAGLKLKEGSTINTENGWTSTDGKTIKTTKVGNILLDAFDGKTIKSTDVQIECVVDVKDSTNSQTLRNIAEITKHSDKDGNNITDRDSQPENLTSSQKSDYNPGTSTQGWGYQDDDDYEDLVVPAKYFDLALRKFITNVNGKELGAENAKPSRVPVISVEKLANGTSTTAEYKHRKDPVRVVGGNIVIYTLRVYNEGQIDGYANSVTDYLPPELEFVTDDEEQFNAKYGWVVDSTLRKATTTYLSMQRDEEDNLIKAFDATTMKEPDYKELKIKCRVKTSTPSKAKITNVAEITQYSDKYGNTNIIDRDSTANSLTNNNSKPTDDIQNDNLPTDSELPEYKGRDTNKSVLTDGLYFYKGQQDDDDFEKLILEEFDLALRKFITGVNNEEVTSRIPVFTKNKDENGNYIYEHTKEPVLVESKDIVEYTIRIFNEGDVAGYAKEVKDNIPEGLQFLPENDLNKEYRWKMIDKDGNETTNVEEAEKIVTDYLSRDQELLTGRKNLINSFEESTMESPDYKDVKVAFKVVAPYSYPGIITNIAEISDDEDEDGDEIEDIDSEPDNDEEDEDDIDEEHLKLAYFDLALRKFITGVNDKEVTNRVPVFTKNKDENGNYIYEHTKEPVEVESTDVVEYTLRIYNEGQASGYAKEVKDNIPEGLEFLPENNTNKEYRWKMLDKDGNETTDVTKADSIVTDYLSKEQEDETGRNNLINKFDEETMESPDYRDIKVAFKVIAPYTYPNIITNIAEISDDEDKDGDEVEDVDSEPDNDDEDEDDIDEEHVKLIYFDLALRKFITAVNDEEITNRIPVFKIDENGNYIYEHTKEPVDVENGNIVTYTLRIFNEGTKAGYAKEVKDDLPDGLLFLPENEINQEYRWKMLDENGEKTENVEEAVAIVTDYLSKEQEDETGRDNLLEVFDPETMEQPDYRDVKIAFKVTEPNTSDRILINKAQISDDSDKDGDDTIDVDSTPDEWVEGEDDQDIEKVKVKYFDLALRKWVTQAIIIEDGKQTVIDTGHKAEDDPEPPVKVELVASKINKVVVKFRYKIRITNEGEIAGSATEISDYIPQGLRFVAADNPTWKEVDGKIVTDQLKDTILQPGESAEVEVLLTWINGKDNMGLKTNIAEISKDWNDSDTPDIDSTPNNKKDGEDDIDDAPVILSVKTGGETTYVGLIVAGLVILAGGVIIIKKYVIG